MVCYFSYFAQLLRSATSLSYFAPPAAALRDLPSVPGASLHHALHVARAIRALPRALVLQREVPHLGRLLIAFWLEGLPFQPTDPVKDDFFDYSCILANSFFGTSFVKFLEISAEHIACQPNLVFLIASPRLTSNTFYHHICSTSIKVSNFFCLFSKRTVASGGLNVETFEMEGNKFNKRNIRNNL